MVDAGCLILAAGYCFELPVIGAPHNVVPVATPLDRFPWSPFPPTGYKRAVLRRITGFHQDDHGDWVAELSCLHGQHVRHQPPFRERPWVLTAEGREARIGTDIDCPLCDQAVLPDGLRVVRTAGPFDETTVPPGLRRDHRVPEGHWGRLRVMDGAVELSMATDPPLTRRVETGDEQPIPPGVVHAVQTAGRVLLALDVLAEGSGTD